MKKLIMFFAAVFSLLVAQAQAPVYNPYLSTASVSPAPLAPVEFNGTGVLTFTIGNGGTDDLLWDPAIPNNDMIVVITLSRGVPNVPTLDATTALDALGGTFSSMFDWTYDVVTNTYNGRQVQTIAAGASGTIVIQYKVTENSFQLGPQNGFNVNLTPPPYTNGENLLADDAVNAYTYTEFSDFGDAPDTYPVANHFIDGEDYLGDLVDGEMGNQPSLDATGDDVSGTDDEDGVTLPVMVQGETVTVTITHTGIGYLNAWIDWNGDADFADAGEQIATNAILASGFYEFSVTVPWTAISTQPTFARFRMGPSGTGPSGTASFGEVEDYMVSITCTPPSAPLAIVTQPDCDTPTGSIEVESPVGQVFEYSLDEGLSWQQNPLFADLTPGTYTVTVRDVSRDLACWSEAAFVINDQPPTPVAPTVDLVHPTCDVATGSIEVTAPTGTGFTYSVGGVYAASTLFEGLLPGTYTVTVMSADGCVSSATQAVIDPQPETPEKPVVEVTQPTCNVATGTIEITSPTGEGYIYSVTGESYVRSALFEDLLPGTYTVTVMDEFFGCVSSETTVTIDPQPETPIAPELSLTQPDCLVATGTIEVTSPLEDGYSYNIVGSSFTATYFTPIFEDLAPGTYTVTVTSADGCVSAETAATIDMQPPTPEMPAVDVIQPDCIITTGTITVLSPPGDDEEEVYMYSIGEGYQESPVFEGLLPGTYSVTARNSFECESEALTVTIEFGGVTPEANAGPDKTIGCEETEVTLEGSSETEGVSFSWEGPGIVSGGDTATPTVNAAGTYTLTVTHDASGCTATDVVTVTQNLPPHLVLNDKYCVYLTAEGKWTLNSFDIAQITGGSSSMNGGGLTFTFSRRTFECRDVYPPYAKVTVTATDEVGCVTSGTFNLMVLDTIAPVAKCRDITVELDAFGQVLVVPGFVNDGGDRENVPEWAKYYKDLEGGSYDNCGINEMYLTKSIFTRDDVGPNQVVLTVIDPSGNIAECEATVTVVDPFEEEAGVPGDGGEEGGEDPEVILPNTAPTLADVTDIEVMNQALQLDVLLTGISAGSEIDQTVKVTAVADNPSLVSGIAVIYTQGSTGQLLVTVAPGMSGEAWITVTVKDDGGTANGGVDMIQKKFKVKVTHSGEEVTIGITDPDGEEVVTATIDLAVEMGFKLYPNPTRGRVNIEMTGTGIRDTEVSVYTIQGTQLFRKLYKAGEQINVDLSPYVSGVYMVRTQSEGVTFLRKVILDK
ncbi:MAG: T9SS type A sorting domain-containing protein [Bacteroidales bacterium]|nr:T9SS type A sorting domain-containing protein [Bacteroidales bacterium]